MNIRLYPSRTQAARLDRFLLAGRLAFNRGLDARISWYKSSGKSLSLYDQFMDLTELRQADPFWGDVPVEIQRDALRRLDKAYKAFFRRAKSGQKAGFPRFKGRHRWSSFAMQSRGRVVRGNRIIICGVDGQLRARNLRTIDGKIVEQRIVQRAGKWFCQLVIDSLTETPSPVPVNSAVGIDVGLKVFATLSNGDQIFNPRFGRMLSRKLTRAHRNVSRSKKGSSNRRKAVAKLQRVYATISDARWNFTHHASKKITTEHQLIAVENLNVAGMVRSRLAKSILDACWSQFTTQLAYKAEEAGGIVVRVNPAGTSQECSQCGEIVQKDLSVRVHKCDCGLVLDRDLNAARNILKRALIEHPVPVGQSVMPVEESVATPVKQEVLFA